MKEFQFPGRKDAWIHCCQWLPEGKPLGVVQILHGIAEYAARYDTLARVFTTRGYVVTAEDHMGHGVSICPESPRGCLEGGWSALVSDSFQLLQITKEQFPNLPFVLYGHSMGSFMARSLLYRYPQAGLQAVILSGTGWMPKSVLLAGRALCRASARRIGWDAVSPALDKLMFGSYNKAIPAARTPWDWLSRDQAEVDRYVADPLLGFSPSLALADALFDGMLQNETRINLIQMPKELPLLFISGDQDPVGSYGAGVRQTLEAFRKAGMKDLSLKLYPGARHELHNELNRQEVQADLLSFLDRFR